MMKKTILSALRGFAASVMTVCAMTACSNDDNAPVTPAPQTFSGELTTTLPSMPTFEAITGENTAVLTWADADQSKATVKLGAFKIAVSTPRGEMSYEIGEMTIINVECAKNGSKITLSKPEFECQAGDFLTKGSLTGTLENGKLTFTLLYKPGTMPFDVQSVFVSK